MRFLGNKESILEDIVQLMSDKGLLKSERRLKFFDAFAGTGSVSDRVKGYYDVIINDNLLWSSIYAKGKVYGNAMKFEKLEVDPFDYINSNKSIKHGFFYNNYSLGGSDRKYFSEYNAGRIDYIRNLIEQWKNGNRLSSGEYEYLLASLIESVSKVANTAGVYGAFLKKWDARALKELIFIPVKSYDEKANKVVVSNKKIEDIVQDFSTDILYLDPPYTQNQYGTQYHIFETLVRNDNPKVSKITGSRPTGPMRSGWSKDYEAHILFDKVLANTDAKYVILSYSSDGIMSEKFIEASMKRYGIDSSYEMRKIDYKKYQNVNCKNKLVTIIKY